MSGLWKKRNLQTQAHCHAQSVAKKYGQESIRHTGPDVFLGRKKAIVKRRDISRYVNLNKNKPEIGRKRTGDKYLTRIFHESVSRSQQAIREISGLDESLSLAAWKARERN